MLRILRNFGNELIVYIDYLLSEKFNILLDDELALFNSIDDDTKGIPDCVTFLNGCNEGPLPIWISISRHNQHDTHIFCVLVVVNICADSWL